MKDFVLLFVIIIILLLLYYFKDKIRFFFFESEKKEYPYKKKDFLLNIAERKFFEELKLIIPDNYVIFPQVVLSSIVSVSKTGKEFLKYKNKIDKKTIDFVIFEKPYYKPTIAIEYDGATHNRPDRLERDDDVNKILEASEISCLHVKHSDNINFKELKNTIENSLIKKDV